MKNFLNMIGQINKRAMVLIEGAIYRAGDNHIEGYQVGTWKSMKIGDHWIAYPDIDGKVRLTSANNFCDVQTDAKSAGAAISLLLVNHMAWAHSDAGNAELAEAFSVLYYAMLDSAYDSKTLDHAAIAAFLD